MFISIQLPYSLTLSSFLSKLFPKFWQKMRGSSYLLRIASNVFCFKLRYKLLLLGGRFILHKLIIFMICKTLFKLMLLLISFTHRNILHLWRENCLAPPKRRANFLTNVKYSLNTFLIVFEQGNFSINFESRYKIKFNYEFWVIADESSPPNWAQTHLKVVFNIKSPDVEIDKTLGVVQIWFHVEWSFWKFTNLVSHYVNKLYVM